MKHLIVLVFSVCLVSCSNETAPSASLSLQWKNKADNSITTASCVVTDQDGHSKLVLYAICIDEKTKKSSYELKLAAPCSEQVPHEFTVIHAENSKFHTGDKVKYGDGEAEIEDDSLVSVRIIKR
jgi:hypothetical protein